MNILTYKMPELPEVETTKRGIEPFLVNQIINEVVVRQAKLRLPISSEIAAKSLGQQIKAVTRRAKYLLIELSQGFLLNHLGMSGHLRIVKHGQPPGKHDHFDLLLNNGYILRYNDPRRFGLWLYIDDNPEKHRLLSHLGPEPLSDLFNADYLYRCAQNKKQCIKSFIMTNEVVVGVGNIYATESLFLTGIHPEIPAGLLSINSSIKLVDSIKYVLEQAIQAGGTTLRDFYASDGKTGYFVNNLLVYGRKGLPCFHCETFIEAITIGGRRSAFCPKCQPRPF